MTGLSHGTISRVERGSSKPIQPWILGRILPLLSSRFSEVFPHIKEDLYDHLVPPRNFAGWLRNFRLRRGLQQKELAKALGIARFTLQRYEMDLSSPRNDLRSRILELYGANGSAVAQEPSSVAQN